MQNPKQKKPRGKISKFLLPDMKTKIYKDNREKFRMFNKLDKEQNVFAFRYITIASIIFTIIPLCVPLATYTPLVIIFLVLGATISIGLEQGANIHYWHYSKIANDKNYDSVKINIIVNRAMRTLAMGGWILTVLAIVAAIFYKGSIAAIW